MKIKSLFKYFKFPSKNKKRIANAAFFDLDGVLWNNESDTNWMRFKVDSKIKKQLKMIQDRYERIIVVTNQTYGARKFRHKLFYDILLNIRFQLFLLDLNMIDKVYICTHHPFATQVAFRKFCLCRKPHSKNFYKAESDFNIKMENSLMVGDRITDLYASSMAGIKNNYLIVNDDMFELSQNINFDYLSRMPTFKFSSDLEEVISIDKENQNAFSADLQILYLAAGAGTRLKPITDTVPKPLIEIQGKKILQRLITQVERYEPMAAHIVNISYLAKEFALLPKITKNSRNISFIYEPIPVGSVRSLLNLARQSNFTKNILVFHGDLFVSPTYIKSVLHAIRGASKSLVFGHYRAGFQARSSIKIDQHNQVTSIVNLRQADSNLHIVNSGVYFFRHQDLIKLETQYIDGEIADILLPLLAKEKILDCCINTFPRISIDSLDSLTEALNSNFEA